MDPLERAIKAAGSKRKLARALGVSRQAIGMWKLIPPHRVIAVEKATGIPREQLRPDLAKIFGRRY